MSDRSLLYGASVLTGSAIATQLMDFGYRVLLSRMMGAEAMGIYHLVLSVYSVMTSVCLTGLSTASARLSAQYAATGRRELISSLIKRLFFIFAALSLSVCILLLLGDRFISGVVLNEDRTRSGIVFLVPVILLTGVENILKNHFIGVGNVMPEALCETVEMAVRAIAAVLLLYFVRPSSAETAVACVICAMAVSEVFSSCAMLVIFKRSMRGSKAKKFRGELMGRSIASIAVPVAFTSFASNLLSSANNVLVPARLMLGGMDKAEAMSAMGEFFGMTLPMVALPAILIDGLLGILMPTISDHMARGDINAVRRKASKAFLAVIIYIVPALTIMIPLFPDFAKVLYSNYGEYRYIFLLCIWMAVCSVRSVSSVVLTGIGKQGIGALTFIAGSLVQLVFTWSLTAIPGVGMTGVAVGMIVSAVITLAFNLYFIHRFAGLKIMFCSWFVCPVVSAAGAYTAGAVVVSLLENMPCAALVRTAVTAVVYLVLIRAMGIKSSSLLVLGRKG